MNLVKSDLIKANIIKGTFSILNIDKGIDNQNYLVSVDGKKDKFILKVYSSNNTEEIKYEIEILNKLRSITRTRKYFPIVRSDIFYIGSKPSVLFEYIPGRTLTTMDINSFIIKKVVKKQAKLHSLLVNYIPKHKKFRFQIFDFRFTNLYMPSKSNLYYSLIRSEISKLKEEVESTQKINLQRSIIHEDLNVDNVIINKQDNIKFIDFGDSHRAEIISDIATAIKELILNYKGINLNLIRDYLDSYQAITHLNGNELNLLPFLLRRRTLFMLTYLIYKQDKNKELNLKKRINNDSHSGNDMVRPAV